LKNQKNLPAFPEKSRSFFLSEARLLLFSFFYPPIFFSIKKYFPLEKRQETGIINIK